MKQGQKMALAIGAGALLFAMSKAKEAKAWGEQAELWKKVTEGAQKEGLTATQAQYLRRSQITERIWEKYRPSTPPKKFKKMDPPLTEKEKTFAKNYNVYVQKRLKPVSSTKP